MGTSSENEESRALLKKYLADKVTPEEKERLELWYNSFDLAPLPHKEQEDLSLAKVKRAVMNVVKGSAPVKRNLLFSYIRFAAMLALIASVSFLIYHTAYNRTNALPSYHAANGQTTLIRLDDGSVVTLNSGSALRIISDFKQNTREVSLSGEAYFQVAKDPSRPFIVRTGTIKTRVLGTSFNVQAYKNEQELTVTVAEGKVRVDQDLSSNQASNLSPGITPGKQLIYNRAGKTAVVLPADAEHTGAWRKGIIYLDNESIPAIARKLERKFNIKIRIRGQINADCRYTLRIGDEKLDKVLEVLTLVSGVRYQFNQPNDLILNTSVCK